MVDDQRIILKRTIQILSRLLDKTFSYIKNSGILPEKGAIEKSHRIPKQLVCHILELSAFSLTVNCKM